MWWVLFGCMSELEEVPERVLNTEPLSQGAETVIQHLQTQSGAENETNGVQVWLTPGVDWVQPLAGLFGGKPITDRSQLRHDTILVAPIVKGLPVPRFGTKRVVSVLEGEWLPNDVHRILEFSEGLIELEKSLARYTSPNDVSTETKTVAIALELNNHYEMRRRQIPESWRSNLDQGLWSKVSPEWLTVDAPDRRTRKIESITTADTVSLLSQVNHDWSPSELIQLVKHLDPWVRAQAALMTNKPQYLVHLANDDSSVVRVAALHQMNQNILSEDGCFVSDKQGTQSGVPSCQSEYCKPFIRASRHSDAYVRWKGAFGLQFCTADTGELIRLLKDPDIDVQREAVHSLRHHNLNTKQVESVLELTRSSNSFVRRWAWETVVTMPIELTSYLTECIESESSILAKQICVKALKPLGIQSQFPEYHPPSRNILSNPSAAVNHPDPTYRKDAAKFFAGRVEMIPYLEKLLLDSDGEVRKTAAEALGYSRSDLVWNALTDSDPDVLIAALESIRIGQIMGPLDVLLPLLSHTDTEVVLRTVESLVSIQEAWSSEITEGIKGMKDHPDERIRAAIASRRPEWFDVADPSLFVRWTLMNSISIHQKSADSWLMDKPEYGFWMQGIIQDQDDLVHDIFSWTDAADRPQSHRALRPPRFAPYGHPNRG